MFNYYLVYNGKCFILTRNILFVLKKQDKGMPITVIFIGQYGTNPTVRQPNFDEEIGVYVKKYGSRIVLITKKELKTIESMYRR